MTPDERPASEPADAVVPDAAAESAADVATAAKESDAAPQPYRPVVDAPVPSRSFWTRIDKPFVFGLLVTLGGLTAFLLAITLSNLSTVLIYIAFALFAALGLDPAVRFLERRGLSRGISVLIVILGLVGVLVLVLLLIIPVVVEQVTLFVRSVPQLIADFMAGDVYAWLEKQFGDQFEQLVEDAQKFLTDGQTWQAIGGGALQIGTSIATGISGVIVVLVLTLYFVAGLPSIKTSMLRLAPARDRERASDLTDQITDSVGGYVGGMVTLAFMNAIVVLILYMVLGLPFPPLMATVAFLITLIPLVGSVLFWIIGSVIAVFADPWQALIFAVLYLIYMQIEAYVLTPRIMNKAVSVPGPLVVIGALAGGTLLGLLGALVAVPVTASILIIIKQVWIPRQDSRV
ncbi:AI-2E family transporter [Microbacterium sp. H1-D42]|uniref:AI-2E family transporter n=1 Tax=Microbacterium sp. H1-D42 TaxID=2925844 RepID=UPI001F53611B|nr:AI-2E family transporter [Microbacterium sp. H1-D42]UNK70786.1 AI-2E family transporter [Microbacterium sp. H1-D42]